MFKGRGAYASVRNKRQVPNLLANYFRAIADADQPTLACTDAYMDIGGLGKT